MNSDSAPASDENPLKPAALHAAASESVPQRTVNSADLFQGAREVQIRHDEKIYRLQVTRNGKLILIK